MPRLAVLKWRPTALKSHLSQFQTITTKHNIKQPKFKMKVKFEYEIESIQSFQFVF